jgi:hypothetical protein
MSQGSRLKKAPRLRRRSAGRIAALCLAAACSGCFGRSAKSPACPVDLEGRARAILRDRGVGAVTLHLPATVARDQATTLGGICPTRGLERAVVALMTSRVREGLVDVAGDTRAARSFFDRESSLFGIVAGPDAHVAYRFLPMPPDPGDLTDYWVFFLSAPDLGEHGFWALVPRRGGPARVIGRN